MTNNVCAFHEKHPELDFVIAIHLMGWEEQYNVKPYIDIATSREDADARITFYQSQGLHLVDEDCFGIGSEQLGIIQCYLRDKE